MALGEDLRPETLLEAYSRGIFPWPMEGIPLPWVSPDPRALLCFSELHVSRRLQRLARKSPFRLTIDAGFDRVIATCAMTHRRREGGTWITRSMQVAYNRLHDLGHAHSVEAWEGDDLVGGIYGVDAGGAFSAESMFYHRPNASKLAFLHLVEHLVGRGLSWMDVQQLTPHMESFGAREIPRITFLRLLAKAQREGLVLFPSGAQGG